MGISPPATYKKIQTEEGQVAKLQFLGKLEVAFLLGQNRGFLGAFSHSANYYGVPYLNIGTSAG